MAGWFDDFDLGGLVQSLLGNVLSGGALSILGGYQGREQQKINTQLADEAAARELAGNKELIELRASLEKDLQKDPFLGFTQPQKVAAMQNQQKYLSDALNQLVQNYQRMLVRG